MYPIVLWQVFFVFVLIAFNKEKLGINRGASDCYFNKIWYMGCCCKWGYDLCKRSYWPYRVYVNAFAFCDGSTSSAICTVLPYKKWHFAVAAIWTLHNDAIDYLFWQMPRYGIMHLFVGEIGYFTFWLSIAVLCMTYYYCLRENRKQFSL